MKGGKGKQRAEVGSCSPVSIYGEPTFTMHPCFPGILPVTLATLWDLPYLGFTYLLPIFLFLLPSSIPLLSSYSS